MEKLSDTPAPGRYSPERVNLDKGPQFTISGRNNIEKPDNNPGTIILI